MSRPPGKVGDLAITYLMQRKARGEFTANTVATTRDSLLSFARSVGWATPPAKITRRHVEHWLEQHPRWSPATARKHRSAVHTFMVWLIADGRLKQDPFIGMTKAKVPRVVPRTLHAEQVGAAFHACRDARDALLVRLMVGEGLRAIEVAQLEVGDIDLHDRVMLLRGKGGHERQVPISDETYPYLVAYLAGQPRVMSGPLIRSQSMPERGVKPPTIVRAVSRVMHDGEVNESGHALRHTCAHDLVDRGANLRDVQTLLGHANLSTTSRYVGFTALADLRKVVNGRDYRLEP